jgi:hypothetical protein
MLNKVLRKYFEETLKPDLKEFTPRFKTPLQICPLGFTKGLQAIEALSKIKTKVEGGGYCQIWSLFLLETVLLNPTISTQEIIKNVIDISKSNPDYLLNVVRGYVNMLSKNIKELSQKLGKEFSNLSIRDKSIFDSLSTKQRREVFNTYLKKLVDDSLLRSKQKPELIPEKLVERSDEKLKKELDKEMKEVGDDSGYLYYHLVNKKLKPPEMGYGVSFSILRKESVKKLIELGMTLKEYTEKNKWLPEHQDKKGKGRYSKN